jgi:hypothetical protein
LVEDGRGVCENINRFACDFAGGEPLFTNNGIAIPCGTGGFSCACNITVTKECKQGMKNKQNQHDDSFGMPGPHNNWGNGLGSDPWGFSSNSNNNHDNRDNFGQEDDFRSICEFDCDRCENTTFRIRVCNTGTQTLSSVHIVDEDLDFDKTITNFPADQCRTFDISRFIGEDEINEVIVTAPSQADVGTCVVTARAEVRINREKHSQHGFDPIGFGSDNKNNGDSGSAFRGPPPAPWQRRSGTLFPRFP